MKTIWKFPCPIRDGAQPIDIPLGAKILCVQTQHNEPCIWALLDSSMPATQRKFIWRGTGHDCSTLRVLHHETELSCIGTVQLLEGDLVFHLFEVP